MGRAAPVLLMIFVAWATPAEAAPDSLTAARVIELARAGSPEILLGRTRVEEARGQLEAAGALHTENPTIEGLTQTDDRFERRTEWELTVPIDPGWSRLARTRVARAELQRAEHQASYTTQRAVGAALQAFYRVLHARDRLAIAKQRLAVAERVKTAAEERFRSGDAARMDLLLAESELARATSELQTGRLELARGTSGLAVLLGVPLDGEPLLSGDLSDRTLVESPPNQSPYRPDVLAAEREVAAAEGERALAMTAALPKVAFRLDYGHESGVGVARPGVALTVPLFNAGHGERGAARARRERARIELKAREVSAQTEMAGLKAAYEAAQASAEELARNGIPQSREVEEMAQDAYRAGKINLVALLQVQREVLETRREYTDRLLEAAMAAVDLAVATGRWR